MSRGTRMLPPRHERHVLLPSPAGPLPCWYRYKQKQLQRMSSAALMHRYGTTESDGKAGPLHHIVGAMREVLIQR